MEVLRCTVCQNCWGEERILLACCQCSVLLESGKYRAHQFLAHPKNLHCLDCDAFYPSVNSYRRHRAKVTPLKNRNGKPRTFLARSACDESIIRNGRRVRVGGPGQSISNGTRTITPTTTTTSTADQGQASVQTESNYTTDAYLQDISDLINWTASRPDEAVLASNA
jgi:hypothetical protein